MGESKPGSSPPAVTSRRGNRLTSDEISRLMGPDGPLALAFPDFEHRQSQVDMAVAVAETFREGGELLVEAGTGTGKTLAYLVPAVLSGQRVVVSTGTKNLQEQLYFKDIPQLGRAMRSSISACLMKGRSNYLCLLRHEQFAQQPTFRFFEEAEHFDTLTHWAAVTKTGDRAEVPRLPDSVEFWGKISARSENCVGKECRYYDRCYVTRLRGRAAESQLVIVNHHLLFADLIVREGSYGEVLPEYDYLVIDEAHQLEDVATQYFGRAVSNARVDELVRDTQTAWEGRTGAHRQQMTQLRDLRQTAQVFFESYRAGKERYRIGGEKEPADRVRGYRTLQQQLERVAEALKGIPEPDESTTALARRSSEIAFDLELILSAPDPDSVSWCEERERSVMLRCSPIQVRELVRQNLLETKRAVVLTSATLAVDGSFEYVCDRLGVHPRDEKLLASPFDFSRQTILYIPQRMPSPRHPTFAESAAEEILELTRASRGRAFVLFTSFANLRAVHRLISSRIDYPLLVQGEASRAEVLDRFRGTEGAVLLATSSFWQGVDVAGEQLSCVIIDKLPFAPPTDPLVSARIDWVERHGGNGFEDYQVPMAILSLKQGLGRLIRSQKDRGALAILDSRLLQMRYGRRFLASLPPCPLTHRREDVSRFFSSTEKKL